MMHIVRYSNPWSSSWSSWLMIWDLDQERGGRHSYRGGRREETCLSQLWVLFHSFGFQELIEGSFGELSQPCISEWAVRDWLSRCDVRNVQNDMHCAATQHATYGKHLTMKFKSRFCIILSHTQRVGVDVLVLWNNRACHNDVSLLLLKRNVKGR